MMIMMIGIYSTGIDTSHQRNIMYQARYHDHIIIIMSNTHNRITPCHNSRSLDPKLTVKSDPLECCDDSSRRGNKK